MVIYILSFNLIISITILILISIYAYKEWNDLKDDIKAVIDPDVKFKDGWSDPHINGNLTKKTPKVKTDKDLWERDRMR